MFPAQPSQLSQPAVVHQASRGVSVSQSACGTGSVSYDVETAFVAIEVPLAQSLLLQWIPSPETARITRYNRVWLGGVRNCGPPLGRADLDLPAVKGAPREMPPQTELAGKK